MLILERSVTKAFWLPMQTYLERRLNRGDWRRVPGHRVVNVTGSPNVTSYVVLQDGQLAAWLYLGKRRNWTAWEVKQVWTFPEHRGKGLGAALYRAAINGDGLLLASGKTHTKWSRALWRSFVERGTFNIWAHDLKDLRRTSTVWIEDGQVTANLPIYEQPRTSSSTTDVRLLALKKERP